VIRTVRQRVSLVAVAREGRLRAIERSRDLSTDADSRLSAQQDADYLDADYLTGVIATLAWAFGYETATPVTNHRSADVTTRALKAERLHAHDVIEQAANLWMADRLPSMYYGEGVKLTLDWLLGDTTAQPVTPVGRGP
jgi:hypothetical protein